jgi:hypothetical protein
MTKAEWKRYYRQVRIIRRESLKAAMDVLVFGAGFVRIGPEVKDFIEHVDTWRVYDTVSG